MLRLDDNVWLRSVEVGSGDVSHDTIRCLIQPKNAYKAVIHAKTSDKAMENSTGDGYIDG